MMRKFSGAAIALAFLTAFSIRVSAQSAIVKDFKEVFLEVKCRSKNLIFRMITQQFNLLCFFRV